MDTKLKNWTARTAVKIISFILILAMCFFALNRIHEIDKIYSSTGISPEIVLTNLSDSQVVYRRDLANTYYHAARLMSYKSEESILAGEHIKWEAARGSWGVESDSAGDTWHLIDRHTGYTYNELWEPYMNSTQMKQNLEWSAIHEQLGYFREAKKYMEGVQGIEYYIKYYEDMSYAYEEPDDSADVQTPEPSTMEHVLSNVVLHNQNDDYFRAQPIYIIAGNGSHPEQSHNFDFAYYDHMYYPDPASASAGDQNAMIYLAVTQSALNDHNTITASARAEYMRDLIIIAAVAVIAIASLAVLLLGAGRKYADFGSKESGVRFTTIDKPYLDLSLAVVLVYSYLALYLTLNFGQEIWRYRNDTAINILFAAASVIVISPALLWLMSFAKRVKAGQFWRHTLIFALPNWLLRSCVRVAKSLWAGAHLLFKVGVISAVAFIMLLFVGMLGRSELMLVFVVIFTAVVTYFLLRYATRIRKLEQGARGAVGGAYDEEINVGGGELGSIASSISNITAGINTAVEQRMKSERLKTELITNVSHDIRTPLTSIITYTDLLKHEGLHSEKAPEYLDVLVNKSQRLKTLTDELFEAAKAATGNIDVNISQLNIVSLINQVLGELDNSIKSSGLDLRANLPERLSVMADGRLMWRVLENLLSNVFKYSLSGSRAYLTAEPVDKKQVRIDIKNISAVELSVDPAELTERFKRGDDSRADGGSGLGLSIAQSFMTAQGGRLEITIDGDLFKASVYLPVPKTISDTE